MPLFQLVRYSAVALLLCACGGLPEPEDDSIPNDTDALCVSACGQRAFVVQGIPSAENILVTPEQRVFVSGGSNVFEILLSGKPIRARPLLDTDCNFTGLAQRGNVLYAACGGASELYAAELNDEPQLRLIHSLDGMDLPNGMEVGPDDCLYITDGPTPSTVRIPSPQIVRVCFENDPYTVSKQETWLSLGLQFPNGLTRIGNRFYFTDTNLAAVSSQVAAVDWLADGSAGEVVALYTRLSILDDLTHYGDRLIVTDFLSGALILLDLEGNELDVSTPATFDAPSSVAVVGPPRFESLDLLVTEKGLLGDNSSDYGNRLSLFRRAPGPLDQ